MSSWTPTTGGTGDGPRFPARALLAVFGILGLVLTLGIMAILGSRIVDSMSDDSPGSVADQVLPSDLAPDEPGGSGGTAPLRGIDASSQASCAVNKATIETAAQAHNLTVGSWPADLQALFDSGMLDPGFAAEASATFTVSPGGNGVVVEGIGGCAGT